MEKSSGKSAIVITVMLYCVEVIFSCSAGDNTSVSASPSLAPDEPRLVLYHAGDIPVSQGEILAMENASTIYLRIRNEGTRPLQISAISLSEEGEKNFALSYPSLKSIDPEGILDFSLRFKGPRPDSDYGPGFPGEIGSLKGEVLIESDDPKAGSFSFATSSPHSNMRYIGENPDSFMFSGGITQLRACSNGSGYGCVWVELVNNEGEGEKYVLNFASLDATGKRQSKAVFFAGTDLDQGFAAVKLLWDGRAYQVFYVGDNRLYYARFSEDGSLLAEPRVLCESADSSSDWILRYTVASGEGGFAIAFYGMPTGENPQIIVNGTLSLMAFTPSGEPISTVWVEQADAFMPCLDWQEGRYALAYFKTHEVYISLECGFFDSKGKPLKESFSKEGAGSLALAEEYNQPRALTWSKGAIGFICESTNGGLFLGDVKRGFGIKPKLSFIQKIRATKEDFIYFGYGAKYHVLFDTTGPDEEFNAAREEAMKNYTGEPIGFEDNPYLYLASLVSISERDPTDVQEREFLKVSYDSLSTAGPLVSVARANGNIPVFVLGIEGDIKILFIY